MCLIALNWQPQSTVPLVIAANRDEFYARPTLPLHLWADQAILAGKDLQAGGTWLGVSTSGRLGSGRVAILRATVTPSMPGIFQSRKTTS